MRPFTTNWYLYRIYFDQLGEKKQEKKDKS